MFHSYRNQAMDAHCKSTVSFLFDSNIGLNPFHATGLETSETWRSFVPRPTVTKKHESVMP